MSTWQYTQTPLVGSKGGHWFSDLKRIDDDGNYILNLENDPAEKRIDLDRPFRAIKVCLHQVEHERYIVGLEVTYDIKVSNGREETAHFPRGTVPNDPSCLNVVDLKDDEILVCVHGRTKTLHGIKRIMQMSFVILNRSDSSIRSKGPFGIKDLTDLKDSEAFHRSDPLAIGGYAHHQDPAANPRIEDGLYGVHFITSCIQRD